MPGDGWVSLADVAGVGKNFPEGLHLLVRQAMDLTELLEQSFIPLAESLPASLSRRKKAQPQEEKDRSPANQVLLHGVPFRSR
jgi:hypothetical protein